MTLLVDRLRADRRWADFRPDSADAELMKEWLTSRYVPVYEVSNVAQYLAESGSDFASLTSFPNVGPLHIMYWLEWRAPTRLVPLLANNGPEPERVGLLVWQEEPPTGGRWNVACHAWGLWPRSKRVEPLVSWALTMDPTGFPEIRSTHVFSDINRLFENRGRVVAEPGTVDLPFAESAEHAMRLIAQLERSARRNQQHVDRLTGELDEIWGRWVTLAVLHPALMAHSLLSCKNVTTETNQPASKLSKRHERRTGKPLVSFKTLRVVPMGRRATAEAGDGFDRSLHIVRGHFKTFTAERPLFGRHVGMYWWAGSLRGNPERGVVIKDYEIGASPVG